MCNKAIDTYPSAIQFVPKCYKTQEMCDKAFDSFLPTLKLALDWFVTSKMIKKLDAIFSNDDIVFISEDSGNVTFSSNEMSILSTDLNDINLDDVNFDEDILKLLLMSDLWLGVTDLNNVGDLIKS